MKPRRVEVHIEELILRDSQNLDPVRIRQAIGRELSTLVDKGALPDGLSETIQIGNRTVSADVESGEGEIGSKVAAEVVGGIRK